MRKQTLAGAERYITPELKEYEAQGPAAPQERIEALEHELFAQLRGEVGRRARAAQAHGRAPWRDSTCCGAFAEPAARCGYCRPQRRRGGELAHRRRPPPGGRAPLGRAQRFVPNDTALDAGGRAIAILTGPNMGGKSTYLRQVALIVLLAQAGSFVPGGERAEIGIVDRIFCRVGAADNLAEGQSHLHGRDDARPRNILHHATPRSLVLLDEIGRGTVDLRRPVDRLGGVEHLHDRAGGRPARSSPPTTTS